MAGYADLPPAEEDIVYVKRGDLWTEALTAKARKELMNKVTDELALALAGFQPNDEMSEAMLIAAAERWYGVRAECEAERVTRVVSRMLRTEFAEEES